MSSPIYNSFFKTSRFVFEFKFKNVLIHTHNKKLENPFVT